MTNDARLKSENEISDVEIEEQISIRKRLIYQMVGSLYKGILACEIDRLDERRRAIGGCHGR